MVTTMKYSQKFFTCIKLSISFSILFALGLSNAFASDNSQIKTKLKFATEATYPPFVYTQPNGQITGVETDIIKAICKKIAFECSFHNYPWDSLITGLKMGKFDAIYGGMTISEERKKHVLFTDIIYTASNSILSKTTQNLSQENEIFSNKKGIKIGIQNGYILENFIKENYPNLTIKYYESILNALQDLKNSRIEGVIADTGVLAFWKKKQPKEKYVLHKVNIDNIKYISAKDNGIAIALPKNNKELKNKIDHAIKELKENGTIDKILNQISN